MSTVGDAIKAIKEVLVLTEKVDRTGQLLSEIAVEMREHDRRLIRIETMIEIGQRQRQLPEPD
jgi:hypothetical protein